LKRKAIFLLYRVLQALASPLVLVYLLWRVTRDRRYLHTLGQRFGSLPPKWQQTAPAAIWFHAVSVGEVLAAVPLIQEVRQRTPGTPVFLSTSTLAGRETAGKRLAALTDGIFYAPLDFVWCVRPVLRRLQPSVVVVLETEIWPNLFREAARLGCGVLIVNGRISDRALPRYRRFAPFFAPVLSLADAILVQSDEMKPRFEAAGAPADRVEVAGNLKYDFTPAPLPVNSPALRFIDADPARSLWIAASTSADGSLAEEEAVLAAQRALPGWRLILAPRKPERFADVARQLAASGLRWTRRSSLDETSPDGTAADILLLDSIGELAGLFSYAKAVFMGGTLADVGGHNILEPAIFGKPVVAGPHLENFRDIAAHFERRHALVRIGLASDLAPAILRAAADPGLGERARAAAEEKRGATAHIADRILKLYNLRYPCFRQPQPVYAILAALSLIWKIASALDRGRKQARARRLPVPVVSLGNVTTGGTGKTPVAIELLRHFHHARPGLLTRGYGRSSTRNVLLLDPADPQTVALTGDEAQLIRRSTGAPIGIGADRFTVGSYLISKARPGMLFLDDGFQHLQLHRDFDLVLIDALRPFGGGHLIPLGRLREPLGGLARASAFVIMRASEVPNAKAIAATLRRYNPRAPIFHGTTVPRRWHAADGTSLLPDELPPRRAVAFCGLGNPDSFWHTLRELGIEPLGRYTYRDHHRYTPAEIILLAHRARDIGAECLLTTAKDAVNLPADYAALIAPIELFWLEISIEFDRPEELDALIAAVRNQ
jgi:3-deoxy-D-manno-octulosonic-acid transferase